MNAPVTAVDIGTRVAQFVKLRDKIKKLEDDHEEKMKPFKDALETLSGIMLDFLNQSNQEKAGTEAGTVYKSIKKTASIADKQAFWNYVVTQGDWDMLDYKANV